MNIVTSSELKQRLSHFIVQKPLNRCQKEQPLPKEHVTVSTQVCNDENVKLLPELVFKGTGKITPAIAPSAGMNTRRRKLKRYLFHVLHL